MSTTLTSKLVVNLPPHPLARVHAFEARLPRELGELRAGDFEAAGRNEPTSESLLRAATRKGWARSTSTSICAT